MKAIALLVLIGVGATHAAASDEYIGVFRLGLESYLDRESIRFQPAQMGADIPMNTLIVMPSVLGGFGGFIQLEFARSDLTEQFIEDFFYGGNTLVRNGHPFAYKQVEPILMADKFILRLHDGLILHLRDDWLVMEDYQTFKDSTVTGKVTVVRGRPLRSTEENVIRSQLREFFVSWKIALMRGRPGVDEWRHRSDGYIQGKVQLFKTDIPIHYEPRVIRETHPVADSVQERPTNEVTKESMESAISRPQVNRQ